MPFVFFEFKKPSLVFLFFAALLWLFTLPIISFLADINHKIAFPTSFSSLENSFRLAEARAENATRFLLNITSVSGLMVNLLVIAVVVIGVFLDEIYLPGDLSLPAIRLA